MQSLIFADKVPVADGIVFHIRTLKEIFDFDEIEYFKMVTYFLADPFDYMYPLYEQGIDYETINEFELFLSLRQGLTPKAMEFLFGDTLSFEGMVPAMDNKTEELVLVDPTNEQRVFNASTLLMIAETIRKIHFFEHEVKRAANKQAKQYFLERAMKRAKRNKNKPEKPVLEPWIISLVNAPEFPYDYSTCKDVTIYQFLSSLHQIPKRLSWNFIMHGVHVGMIDSSKLNWKELDWLS